MGNPGLRLSPKGGPVAHRNPYLISNRRLQVDYLLGYRAWPLVLYGALPSSLAALGVLKVPELTAGRSPFLVALAAAPMVVMFLLVRQRLGAWYLMSNWLWARSVVITLMVLVLSTIVSWAAGMLDGRYDPWYDAGAWTESLRLGIVALVASSALFMTAIKETGGLPALPSRELVSDLGKLRASLVQIQRDDIWTRAPSDAEIAAALGPMSGLRKKAQGAATNVAARYSRRSGDHTLYNRLDKNLTMLEDALGDVVALQNQWSVYFASDGHSDGESDDDEPAPDSTLTPQQQRTRLHELAEKRLNV